MTGRFRLLAALLALFALSASFAEGLWASTCGGMDAGDMASSSDVHAARGMAPGLQGLQEDADDSSPECPLAAVLGGCVATSLPGTAVFPDFVPGALRDVHPQPARAPDLLLVYLFQRPPQA